MNEENDKLNIIHRFDEFYQEKVRLREQFCDEMLGDMSCRTGIHYWMK